jgi:hypothetical protein
VTGALAVAAALIVVAVVVALLVGRAAALGDTAYEAIREDHRADRDGRC